METLEGKITIASCIKKMQPGKTTFWGCETTEGMKFTIWDEPIAKSVEENLNIECDAVLKSSDSGQHWNLRKFDGVSKPKKSIAEQMNPTPVTPTPRRSSNVEVKQNYNVDREKCIIAQCLTKCYAQSNTGLNETQILSAYNTFLKNL